MTRYCASCGTEVDENAIFCPTCGQPIDQETETEMPAAPAWPDPDPRAGPEPVSLREPEPAAPPASVTERPAERYADPEPFPEPATTAPADDAEAVPERAAAPMPDAADGAPAWRADEADRMPSNEPTRTVASVEPPAAPPPAPAPGGQGQPQAPGSAARPAPSVPFTAPVTMSAWLIGLGAAIAALGALIGLFDSSGLVIDLLTLVALLGLAVTVFFPTALPAIPHLRFITLVVVLVAFGVGLDRLGEGRAGAGDLLLFLGAAAAVIGAVLLELGHDQPLGGSQT